MQKNMDQNNSEYGHFLRSVGDSTWQRLHEKWINRITLSKYVVEGTLVLISKFYHSKNMTHCLSIDKFQTSSVQTDKGLDADDIKAISERVTSGPVSN